MVEAGSVNTDAAAAGLLVELRYEGDDDTTTYLMGSIEERHDTYDVLSVSSPLGKAVLGKHPGTKVSYQGPDASLPSSSSACAAAS